MKHKWMVAGAAMAALAMVATACGDDDDEGETSAAGGDLSCGTMSVAVVDDDSHRAGLWALERGEVSSASVDEVEVEYLQIPALIQATGTDQYDVVQTSMNGVALARANGAPILVVYVGIAHTGGGISTYVRADSDVETPADLAGGTIGTPSLGATALLEAKYVYGEHYDLDAQQEGGDVRWTELDPATLLNALSQGDVDAALLWHFAGWRAQNDTELRAIDDLDDEYQEVTGEWPVGSAYTVTESAAADNPACFVELQQLLDDSAAYAADNIADIAPEIEELTEVPAEFIEYWWGGAYEFGGIDDEWISRGQALLDQAAENGDIPEQVDLAELVVGT